MSGSPDRHLSTPFGGPRSVQSFSISGDSSPSVFGRPRIPPQHLGATSQDRTGATGTPVSGAWPEGGTTREPGRTAPQSGLEVTGTTWTPEKINQEYEWATATKDAEMLVPDLNLSTFVFERWHLDLLRTLVGNFPYLIDESGDRLINRAETALERRGNRKLYSAIWAKLTEDKDARAELAGAQRRRHLPARHPLPLVPCWRSRH